MSAVAMRLVESVVPGLVMMPVPAVWLTMSGRRSAPSYIVFLPLTGSHEPSTFDVSIAELVTPVPLSEMNTISVLFGSAAIKRPISVSVARMTARFHGLTAAPPGVAALTTAKYSPSGTFVPASACPAGYVSRVSAGEYSALGGHCIGTCGACRPTAKNHGLAIAPTRAMASSISRVVMYVPQ